MKILVGLGNPGLEYHFTRHNAGRLFLDHVASHYSLPDWRDEKRFAAKVTQGKIDSENWLLVAPQTFMNLSGESVQKVLQFYKLHPEEDLIVAYDDLDLAFGQYKITTGHPPHGHNGVLSIKNHLHTDQFINLRLGIDARNQDRSLPPANYVLSPFTPDEQTKLTQLFADLTLKIFEKVY